MRSSVKTWVILAVLLGTMAYAIAEEITLTTYYPSPRGVYKSLRTTDQTLLATDTTSPTAKVGIGTTSPQAALHLVASPSMGAFGGTLAGVIVQPSTAAGSPSPGILLLESGGGERGGIGAAMAPGLWSTDAVAGDTVLRSATGKIIFATDPTNPSWPSSGDPPSYPARMVIANDGKVGIGTTTPATDLHLYNAQGAILRIEGGLGKEAEIDFYENGGGPIGKVRNSPTYNALMLETMGVAGPRKNILLMPGGGGNVGIGTTDPQDMIHVVGDARFDSTVGGNQLVTVEIKNGAVGIGGFLQLGGGACPGDLTVSRPAIANCGGGPDQGIIWLGSSGKSFVGTDGNGSFAIQQDNAYRIFINTLDNDSVSIGPASNASSYALKVNPTGSSSDNALSVQGNMTITGVIYGGDVAENIDCADCEGSEVVVIDSDHDQRLKKSSRAYEGTVAGVISEKPALHVAGRASDDPSSPLAKPLALSGKVTCKVTTENGPIRRGDLLVASSKPGYAMRADVDKVKPGMLVGKALEPLEKGEGTIMVLIAGQ